VGYSLQYHTEWVLPYLRSREGLSRQERIRLFTNLDENLRERGDFLRNDAERRLAPGSEYFWFVLIFQGDDGRLRQFRFVVSDAAAQYGVLRIVFVDEVEPISLPQ
jgi:hypothetical protein